MKRKIAALLAALLLLSVFVGCGRDETGETVSAADAVAKQPYRYVQRLCCGGMTNEVYWVDNDGRLLYRDFNSESAPRVLVDAGVVSVSGSADVLVARPSISAPPETCVRLTRSCRSCPVCRR